MTAASMKAKIIAAYHARTGLTMADDAVNDIIDLCTGIVQEIQANAVVSATGPDAQGGTVTSTGTIS
jgi:glycerol-3-phosphate dehydrogenase